jgi:chromosomal replication initiation ATPase DnaA
VTPPAAHVARRLHEHGMLGLVTAICHARGVTVEELCGRQRTQAVAQARHEAWWRMRHHPERHYSLAEIGRLFARDHTTVRHGIEMHARRGPLATERAD